jgi:hypothetical protein
MSSIKYATPDLTQHPPRSVRVRLGGFAHLPRLLDKARATAGGKAGEYHFNCPLDRHFFEFTGIDHEQLLAEVKKDKSDTEMLAWIDPQVKQSTAEIQVWSNWVENLGPGGSPGHAWFSEMIKADAGERDDIRSFSDLLDLDDYVSFGGRG